MKAPKLIWPMLLTVAGLIWWLSGLTISKAPQAQMLVEPDVSDISSQHLSPGSFVALDPYFVRENLISTTLSLEREPN